MRTIIDPDNVADNEMSPYQVQSRREIIALLRSIGQQKQMVTLHLNGGRDSVLTSVLEVDEDNNIVYIDVAPSELMNRRIAETTNLSFETVLDHIRILFFSTSVKPCTHNGLPALYLAIPATMIRLQRREFYRVATPISTPVRCVIQVPSDMGMEAVTVNLQNVSGGGIAVLDDKKALDNTIGLIYKDCRIYLPGNTVVTTSLEVRNSHDYTLANGKEMRRIGCLFSDMPAPMLAAIQRYITKLEREQNAKNNGLIK
ncbi:MAG: flagellar brake protein [Proteobacteria bacterium]|nr:flagellar brake protein [Pseudomonadota bacterium]